MKKVLREPLLHFLIIGVILFVFWGFWGDNAGSDGEQIIVGSARIEQIKDAWKKQWRREPTEKELESLIEQFIKEEVLYREALNMGLEKEDSIIRRRLAQKMQFLIQDIADRKPPEEAELKAFFNQNPEPYMSPARVSFTHVYFNRDRRKNTVLRDARDVLVGLQTGNPERAPEKGDPFMLNLDYVRVSKQETARLFGKTFAEDLFALRPGPWQGPIQSGYGIHLVRLVEHIPARLPEFSEVAGRVRQEFVNNQRRKANKDTIQTLKDRYKIVIEPNGRDGS
jgi:peptidyl-prolyl cis-trans isomerase C